jgi:hypothetical protein
LLLWTSLVLAACTTEQRRTEGDVTTTIDDTPAGAVEAAPLEATPPPPVPPPPNAERPLPPAPPPESPAAGLHDRFLARPLPNVDDATWRARVEQTTGARIVEVRPSLRLWVIFTLAPTTPPRTAEDQAAIVERLKGAGVFSAIEADRILKPR